MKTALLFLTDERGYSLTEQAVAAAIVTQKTTRHIVVSCVGFMPPDNSRLAVAAEKQGFNLEFRAISKFDEGKLPYRAEGAHAHVTSAALLKMAAMDSIAGEFDRAVYLDGDILLMEDVNIEKIDFEDYPVAAVYDIATVGGMSTEVDAGGNISKSDFYDNCVKNGRSPHYFNSGVIAADFSKWQDNFIVNFNSFVGAHSTNCDYINKCGCMDQCAWNRVFERSWKRLPLMMNFQACAMFSERWQYAAIRHYVGRAKFMPFKGWRNDARDTRLINQARQLLGLPPVGAGWSHFVRALNVWRNRRQNILTCEAISRVEKMYAEKM
ncbi:MAG: hypothetical protein KGI37_09895 [Alphaproteobacteria bacterium]|nr:hypothetical protein [Alphaproteobacteria bacterium]